LSAWPRPAKRERLRPPCPAANLLPGATYFAKNDHTDSSLFLTVPTGSARFTLIPDKHTTPGMVSPNATQTAKSSMGVVGGLWGFMGVRVPSRSGDGWVGQTGVRLGTSKWSAHQNRPRSRAPPGVGSNIPIYNVQEHCLLFSLPAARRK
jgi:hypothetical protein